MPKTKPKITNEKGGTDFFEPKFIPSSGSSGDYQRKEVAKSVLPAGASLDVGGGGSRKTASSLNTPVYSGSLSGAPGAGFSSTMFSAQRPYMPMMEDPSRMQIPQQRAQWNAYMRMFHRLDPMFGTAIDMYSEMSGGEFDLIFDDESAEIKQQLEYMVDDVHLLDAYKQLIQEFMVLGEAVPHNYFNDETGLWSYITFHNPDYIDVIDVPFVHSEPIIQFVPSEELRMILSETSPESQEMRDRLPQEFVQKILARQKIRLSPLNCTFLARKMSPYDLRGTSIGARLWRTWMVEDAVYAATIATFRRAAAPLKVAKLGDPQSGTIPSPEREQKLMELVKQAELDPQSWITWDFMINFELWGNTDRAITINKEYDVIEKMKLSALGLSKSFMSGEVSYSSSKSGLQVFLRRLLALRQYIENMWLYPKVFKPLAVINGWYKTKPSETAHQYRVKKTAQELDEEKRLIIPRIKWRNKLEPGIDADVLAAYMQLEKFGVKISKSTVSQVVGLDYNEEFDKSMKEFKADKEKVEQTLGAQKAKEFMEPQQGAKPPGGAGGGSMPPSAGGAGKKPTGEPGAPGSAAGPGDKGPLDDKIEAPGEGNMPDTIE